MMPGASAPRLSPPLGGGAGAAALLRRPDPWVGERWALSLLQAGTFLLGIVWAARWALRRLPLRGSFLLFP